MAMKGWKDTAKQFNQETWEDKVRWGELKPKFKQFRAIGGLWPVAQHWIETKSGKMFPMWCPKFNSDSETFEDDRYCPAHDDANLKATKKALGNFIDRELQTAGDTNPIVVLTLTSTQMQEIASIMDLVGCDPADPQEGIDLYLLYDGKASGTDKYKVQRGDKVSLTEEELDFELYPLDEIYEPHPAAEIKDALRRHGYYEGSAGAKDAPAAPAAPARDLGAPPVSISNTSDAPKPDPRPAAPVKTESSDESEEATGGPLECMGSYEGTQKCMRCNDKHECIDQTEGDED
jgi:hypothetical protein